jgi:plasmid stabilization system protein ParE
MTIVPRRSIEISRQAAQEILAQAAYYQRRTLNDRLSMRWERAVTRAIESLMQAPERGAICLFNSPRLKGMRRIPITGFPQHAIYYVVKTRAPRIQIVRVVHGARDIENLLV